jgi:hypothetical protein
MSPIIFPVSIWIRSTSGLQVLSRSSEKHIIQGKAAGILLHDDISSVASSQCA